MSIKLMTMVWDRDISPASHKLVALKLADFANDAGQRIFPSLALVARKSGVSVDTARRAILDLRKLGVLRLIRQGGTGPKSTNEYAFDLDALEAMKVIDDPENSVETDAEPGPADAENKGSKLPPLEADKGSTQNAKGGTGATQTVKNLDNPLTPTAVGASEFVDFEEFEKTWPWYGDERRDLARSAFEKLDEENRRAAIDHAPRYLADLRAGKGRRKKTRLKAAAYLTSEVWKNRKPPSVKRSAFVVRGTPAWDIAAEARLRERGARPSASLVCQFSNPTTGERKAGWEFPVSWLDGAPGEGVDWWIVEIELKGAA